MMPHEVQGLVAKITFLIFAATMLCMAKAKAAPNFTPKLASQIEITRLIN